MQELIRPVICNYSATKALLVENVENVETVYDYNNLNEQSDTTA